MIEPFPAGFRIEEIEAERRHDPCARRRQGTGGRAAARLRRHRRHVGAARRRRWCKDHTVIVPDLRGMGLSSHPDGGYDKKTQARDIAGVLDALEDRQGRSRHARHRQHGRLRASPRSIPTRITQVGGDRCAAARHRPVGRDPEEPDAVALQFPRARRRAAGRRAASASISTASTTSCRPIPKTIDEATRDHYAALYARPGAMHCAFEQFAAFAQDADRQQGASRPRASSPCRCWRSAARSRSAPRMADVMRFVASDVTGQADRQLRPLADGRAARGRPWPRSRRSSDAANSPSGADPRRPRRRRRHAGLTKRVEADI